MYNCEPAYKIALKHKIRKEIYKQKKRICTKRNHIYIFESQIKSTIQTLNHIKVLRI